MADTGTTPSPSTPPAEPGPPLRLPPWAWIWRVLGAAAVVVFASMALYALFKSVRELLIWVFIALFASFALEPAVDWLAKRGWKRGLATGSILFGLVILGIVMVSLMIPLLVQQIQALVRAAPDILEKLSEFTRRWFGIDVSIDSIRQQLLDANSAVARFASNIAGSLFGWASVVGVASAVIGTIFKLLTIGLFTFYLTADGPKVRRAVCSYLPPRQQETVLKTWEVGIEKTGAYLYSRLLLAVISGIVTFLVLTALGVPFAVPLAVWMGLISQFLPTIGTYIAMALPLLVAVVESPVDALILLVFFTLYQQVENYLLSPRITARTMQLHPALAFGFAIAGAMIAGIVGAFLALPFAAIVQALGSTYIQRHGVEETNLTRVASAGESKERREERKRQRGQGRSFGRSRDDTDDGDGS